METSFRTHSILYSDLAQTIGDWSAWLILHDKNQEQNASKMRYIHQKLHSAWQTNLVLYRGLACELHSKCTYKSTYPISCSTKKFTAEWSTPSAISLASILSWFENWCNIPHHAVLELIQVLFSVSMSPKHADAPSPGAYLIKRNRHNYDAHNQKTISPPKMVSRKLNAEPLKTWFAHHTCSNSDDHRHKSHV